MLVAAIETDNLELFTALGQYIDLEAPKPYGRSVTPRKLIYHHAPNVGSKYGKSAGKIRLWLAYRDRVMSQNEAEFGI